MDERLLENRVRAFRDLPPSEQASIDARRWVPTLEMWDMVQYLWRHGRLSDETHRTHVRPIPPRIP